MEVWLTEFFECLFITIGTIGVAIIVWALVLTVFSLLKLEFSRLNNKSIMRRFKQLNEKPVIL